MFREASLTNHACSQIADYCAQSFLIYHGNLTSAVLWYYYKASSHVTMWRQPCNISFEIYFVLFELTSWKCFLIYHVSASHSHWCSKHFKIFVQDSNPRNWVTINEAPETYLQNNPELVFLQWFTTPNCPKQIQTITFHSDG